MTLLSATGSDGENTARRRRLSHVNDEVDKGDTAGSPRLSAISGIVAALAGVSGAELVSIIDTGGPSPLSAVGDVFIDTIGVRVKDIAVAIFGTNHRTALVIAMLLVIGALGAGVGRLHRRSAPRARVAVLFVAVLGLLAFWSRPDATWWVGVVSIALGAVTSVACLSVLSQRSVPRPPAGVPIPGTGTGDRRGFLRAATTMSLGAGAALAVSRVARSGDTVQVATGTRSLPRPGSRIDIPSTGIDTPGVSPYITPTRDFYRIDTALRVPRVDADTWELSVTGLVERPFTINFDELLEMDSVSLPVTIACVSNPVGGDLVGTAEWQGVPLRALLDQAGVSAEAEQIVGRSVDRFTAGFPLAALDDERTAIVAYGMNGEFLPALHGFPARLVVSGLYGYVSATKWLSQIDLTTWDGFDGYWVPLGWSKEGPVKITSRIDTPRNRVMRGATAIGGVAVAPSVGIDRVEVQVDDGEWRTASLGRVAGDDTWVQWSIDWEATSGMHWLRCRAVDSDGNLQVEEPSPVAPDGATGWHTVRIVVD